MAAPYSDVFRYYRIQVGLEKMSNISEVLSIDIAYTFYAILYFHVQTNKKKPSGQNFLWIIVPPFNIKCAFSELKVMGIGML